MFELITTAIFLAAPFALGMWTRSGWALLLPMALLLLSIRIYSTNEPSGDEVDAIPLVMVVLSVAGLIACFVGVLVGRRAARKDA